MIKQTGTRKLPVTPSTRAADSSPYAMFSKITHFFGDCERNCINFDGAASIFNKLRGHRMMTSFHFQNKKPLQAVCFLQRFGEDEWT